MIRVLEPFINPKDVQRVADSLKMGWVSHHGPDYKKFAMALEEYLLLPKLKKRIVLTSSGSTALHTAYVLSKMKEGDHVAIPELTFAATINALFQETQNILIVDVNPDDFNINWKMIPKSGVKVSHIVTVDLFGAPFEFTEEFEDYVKKNHITVIEDSCESLGSVDSKERYTGTRGDYGAFSFFANKIITTGEGGALIVPEDQYEEAFNLVSHFPGGKEYYHVRPGFNYRMSHMSASLGYSQMFSLPLFLHRKREIREFYEEHLEPPVYLQKCSGNSNYWLNCAVFPSKEKRDDALNRLANKGIDYRHMFTPISQLPFAKKVRYVGKGEAGALFRRSLCLPSSVGLSNIELATICEAVNGELRYE